MSTTMKPEVRALPMMEERPASEEKATSPRKTAEYGTKDDLLRGHGPLRTRDVEVLGKWYRVRELKLGEADEIQYRTMKHELDGKGGLVGHADLRGVMALRVACGLIHQDETPFFPKPFQQYVELLEVTADVLNPLDKAITELSGLATEAQEELGKASGGTDGSGASSSEPMSGTARSPSS